VPVLLALSHNFGTCRARRYRRVYDVIASHKFHHAEYTELDALGNDNGRKLSHRNVGLGCLVDQVCWTARKVCSPAKALQHHLKTDTISVVLPMPTYREILLRDARRWLQLQAATARACRGDGPRTTEREPTPERTMKH
jgi:hypothetical protein